MSDADEAIATHKRIMATLRADPSFKWTNSFTGSCWTCGWHEGTKPRDWRGNPVPTCKLWQTCRCLCHAEITEMFILAGKPRVLIENPEWKPVAHNFFPERETIQAPGVLEMEADIPSGVMVSVAPGIVPGASVKHFGDTPSGRAARGQIEYLVKNVTDTWVIEQERLPCTPAYIAKEIERVNGIVVALGSIDYVLNGWSELGFATIEHNPIKFTGYTTDAIELGLDGIKSRNKRAQKYSSNGARGMAF